MLCFFFNSIVMVPTKGPGVDFSSLPKLYEELESGYQQEPLVPICLLKRVQTYLSKVLLVLVSPMLVDSPEFYLVVEQVPIPSQLKHTREGAPLKDTRAFPFTELSLVERYWGISTQLEDTGVGAVKELFEGYQGNTHPVERYWVKFS